MRSTKVIKGDYIYWVFHTSWGYEVLKAKNIPNSIPEKLAPKGDGFFKSKQTAMKYLKSLIK
jgi:hypothetical protein